MGTGELEPRGRIGERNRGSGSETRGKWEQEPRGEGNGNSVIGECYITGEMGNYRNREGEGNVI